MASAPRRECRILLSNPMEFYFFTAEKGSQIEMGWGKKLLPYLALFQKFGGIRYPVLNLQKCIPKPGNHTTSVYVQGAQGPVIQCTKTCSEALMKGSQRKSDFRLMDIS